tara:strand:- start:870 stop:1193 length:324 start_codon:yes stop_codon:yes gene_type:complete
MTEIMDFYLTSHNASIYSLSYEKLVTSPKEEIRRLIDWIGWEWQDSYLSPHLCKRNVMTASKIQVRSPINSKSIGKWKNYHDLLKPALNILEKNPRFNIFNFSLSDD